MEHFSTQGPNGAVGTATIHAKAPGALRRRVMGTVHGDTRDPARHRSLVLTAITGFALLFALIVLVARVGVGHNAPTSVRANVLIPRASLRRIGDHGELTMSGMSDPPAGETYEVWLVRAGRAPQATNTLFTVTSAGSATVDIPGRLHGLRGVLVTAEPLGGSIEPTSPPIVRMALPG